MQIRAILLAFALAGAACTREPPEAIPNVRLGMAPRDVRDRFQPGGADPGSWQTALGAGDDTVLEWKPKDPASKITEARFEFHLGMLVAIRAKTTEPRKREEVSTTPKTVTVWSPAREGGTAVMVLARDCPTHRDEAEGYAARGRPN